MKNSISKTLICGVIASSFMLINCQKAGSGRGVKGIRSGTDNSPVSTPEKANPETTTESFLIKCSPEFLSQYKTWSETTELKTVKNIRSLKKDDLTETQKQELVLLSKRLETETKGVKIAFNSMQEPQKKNLDGCFIGEGRSKNEYLISRIKENSNNIAFRIAELTDEETPASIEGKKEAAERKEKSLAESDVTKNARYYVSEELNEAFDDTRIDETYFMNGKILTGENALNKPNEEPSFSVCRTTLTQGKIEDLNTTLDVVNVDIEKLAGKKTYKIFLTNQGRFYTLSCVLPPAQKLSIGFAEAMGELLLTEKQLAQKEKAKEENAKIEKEEVKKEDEKINDNDEDKEEKETKKEEVKSKTVKKLVAKPAEIVKKIKKIKITAKQKQEFLDEDLKASAKEVEKETETETKSDEVTALFETEEKYIPSHLRSK